MCVGPRNRCSVSTEEGVGIANYDRVTAETPALTRQGRQLGCGICMCRHYRRRVQQLRKRLRKRLGQLNALGQFLAASGESIPSNWRQVFEAP